MDEEGFMREALKNAKKAFNLNEVPVGSVCVYQGKIIAEGYNLVEQTQDATAHAEMRCIHNAQKALGNWRLGDCTLYTTLEPCLMCYGAAILSRVKKIVWGASDLRHGACGGCFDLTKHPIHNLELQGGLLLEPSRDLLKEFFQKTRREKNGS